MLGGQVKVRGSRGRSQLAGTIDAGGKTRLRHNRSLWPCDPRSFGPMRGTIFLEMAHARSARKAACSDGHADASAYGRG